MDWVEVVTIAVWFLAYIALWARGNIRGRAMYWQGRHDELVAQKVLADEGPRAFLELIRAQTVAAVGERDARRFVDRYPMPPDRPEMN